MSIEPVATLKTIGAVSDSVSKLTKLWRWFKSRRYPKPPLNHYGVVISILTENDVQRAQLKTDFLNNLLQQLRKTERLTLLELPDRLALKLEESENARQVLKKTNSVLLLWGRLRRRNVEGEDTYVMDLRSAVRHSPIAKEVQTVLADEMRDLLSGRRLMAASNDLIGFEINALTVDLSAQYIIASAAYLSRQRSLAATLWKELNQRLASLKTARLSSSVVELITTLKKRVTINLTTFHLDEASVFQYEWRKSRDVSFLETMMRHLDSAESYTPHLYQAAILRALYSFVTRRKVKQAREILMPYLNTKDPTVSLDMAFFYAYEGKLTQATGYYRKAFALNPESRLLVEVEEWFIWILSQEPDKTHLHYCLGLINYFGKKDLIKAKQDFENFLNQTGGRFLKQHRQVEKYLEHIQEQGTTELLWETD
jgi:hypothetical protein